MRIGYRRNKRGYQIKELVKSGRVPPTEIFEALERGEIPGLSYAVSNWLVNSGKAAYQRAVDKKKKERLERRKSDDKKKNEG